jgi:hypothetical protein
VTDSVNLCEMCEKYSCQHSATKKVIGSKTYSSHLIKFSLSLECEKEKLVSPHLEGGYKGEGF